MRKSNVAGTRGEAHEESRLGSERDEEQDDTELPAMGVGDDGHRLMVREMDPVHKIPREPAIAGASCVHLFTREGTPCWVVGGLAERSVAREGDAASKATWRGRATRRTGRRVRVKLASATGTREARPLGRQDSNLQLPG